MDDTPASRLPVELWIKVALILRDTFSCAHGYPLLNGEPCPYTCPLKNHPTVLPLAKSCRFLYTAILPILYENIALDRSVTYRTRRMNGLASTLASRPDLRLCVRTLHLRSFHTGRLSEEFLDVLILLKAVRYISLDSGVITSPIVGLLRKAVQLRTLVLEEFAWGEDIPNNWADRGRFGENLTKLILHDSAGVKHPFHAAKTSQLFVPTIKVAEIDSSVSLQLMKNHQIPNFSNSLTKLVTRIDNRDCQNAIIRLLSHYPNIEHLTALDRSFPLTLNPEILIKLYSIEGGSFDNRDKNEFVIALLQGCRIWSLSTYPSPNLFTHSLPELETLRLFCLPDDKTGLQIIDALLLCCTGLRTLDIQGKIGRGMPNMKTWIDARLAWDIAALPRLEVLHLKWKTSTTLQPAPIKYPLLEEVRAEREMVVGIKRRSCVYLYDVWIHPEYAWTYEQASGDWAPVPRKVERVEQL